MPVAASSRLASAWPRLHSLDEHDGPDPPPAPDERDIRGRHDRVLVPEPDLPLRLVHELRERRGAGRPLRRALYALHVQLLRVHDDRLTGLQPIVSDGCVLHVLGVLALHDHLSGLDAGTAFERNLLVAVPLLVLYPSYWWEWRYVGKQQNWIHVLPHRHGEYTGVYHRSVINGLWKALFGLCVDLVVIDLDFPYLAI